MEASAAARRGRMSLSKIKSAMDKVEAEVCPLLDALRPIIRARTGEHSPRIKHDIKQALFVTEDILVEWVVELRSINTRAEAMERLRAKRMAHDCWN